MLAEHSWVLMAIPEQDPSEQKKAAAHKPAFSKVIMILDLMISGGKETVLLMGVGILVHALLSSRLHPYDQDVQHLGDFFTSPCQSIVLVCHSNF